MESQIYRKSQEIAFALTRMAASIRRFDLRKKFESLATHLLENCYYRNFDLAIDSLRVIYGFLEFGKNIYEIEPVNARIIGREVYDFRLALEKLANQSSVSLESIFSSNVSTNDLPTPSFESGNKEIKKNKEKEISVNNTASKSGNSNFRQSAIVNKLKQEGNLQLRDIVAGFSDVTERTIRYDLKHLIDTGLIRREGRGPASFYSVPMVSHERDFSEIRGEVGDNTELAESINVSSDELEIAGSDTVING